MLCCATTWRSRYRCSTSSFTCNCKLSAVKHASVPFHVYMILELSVLQRIGWFLEARYYLGNLFDALMLAPVQARMLQMEKSLAFKDKPIGALTQEMRMLQDRYSQPP